MKPDLIDWIVAFIAVAGVPLLATMFILLRRSIDE